MGVLNKISVLGMMALFCLSPVAAQTGTGDDSMNRQGSYGLGFVLGDPGTWGVAGIL